MKRVLVFGMTENPGGVESFLMNYYRHINREKIQFDFLCNSYEPVAYEDELIEMGGRTFHITSRRKNRALFYKELDELFSAHSEEWSAIWVNVCSLANIDYLKIAKKYGIKKRIIHSHNSENMDNFVRGVLHTANRHTIEKYATDFWACSEDAAKWFYNSRIMKKAIVIRNAIDVQKFLFNSENRKEIRSQINATEGEIIIGNVGRLHFQKNQTFAIEVFNEFLKKRPDSRLILIGQGEDRENLMKKCAALGISEKVMFAGIQSNVEKWLSAFDLFLFPSLFEGLSVVALEAQANGVTVLASEGVIPKEVKMNENFEFFSLDKSAEEWSGILETMTGYPRPNRDTVCESFHRRGFDIEEEVKKLEQLLLI